MDRSKGNLRGVALLPLAALALSMMAGCMKQTQHAADVWAVVNGKEIKRDEVDKYYRTRVNPEGQEPSQEEALSLKLNVIDELINNEILLERANYQRPDGCARLQGLMAQSVVQALRDIDGRSNRRAFTVHR